MDVVNELCGWKFNLKINVGYIVVKLIRKRVNPFFQATYLFEFLGWFNSIKKSEDGFVTSKQMLHSVKWKGLKQKKLSGQKARQLDNYEKTRTFSVNRYYLYSCNLTKVCSNRNTGFRSIRPIGKILGGLR